jgi:hypothetical protein
MMRKAEASGLLVDGKLPQQAPESQPMFRDPLPRSEPRLDSLDGDLLQPPWSPPPEFRHKKDHLPEVTRLQFRYFDGSAWQLDWDEVEALPRAIEISFDLDSDAPAARAKEFAEAHELMLGGASMQEVLPEEELSEDEFEDEVDPLLTLNMEDPTAIVTEYRFVIALPKGRERDAAQNDEREENRRDDDLEFTVEDRP